MSTVAERVARGAAWLDANRPGWVEDIDLDTLDLGNPCCCMLGQEFGEYILGLDTIGDTTGEWPDKGAAARGFYASCELYADAAIPAQVGEEYAELTEEWRALIQARRGGAA